MYYTLGLSQEANLKDLYSKKEYDREKFLQLTEDQTYENAVKIYDGKIDQLIEDFLKTLKSH